MREVLQFVRDRDTVRDAVWLSLDAESITRFYADFVVYAVDKIEDELTPDSFNVASREDGRFDAFDGDDPIGIFDTEAQARQAYEAQSV
jgi:hypothetical protein